MTRPLSLFYRAIDGAINGAINGIAAVTLIFAVLNPAVFPDGWPRFLITGAIFGAALHLLLRPVLHAGIRSLTQADDQVEGSR